jgi:hypothetical protein
VNFRVPDILPPGVHSAYIVRNVCRGFFGHCGGGFHASYRSSAVELAVE